MFPVTAPEYGSYRWLCRDIGEFLGLDPNWHIWSEELEQKVARIVEQGLWQYYRPPAVDGYAHEWTFMKPVGMLTLEAGVKVYELPLDFERIDGNITYADGDDFYAPIVITSEQRLRELEFTEDFTSYPTMAAVRPRGSIGAAQQLQELVFYPTPNDAYTLRYRYFALPRMLSDDYPYPLGGTAHAEGILASCMAVAEVRRDGKEGAYSRMFVGKLSANIVADMRRGPQYLGYNGDGSVMQGDATRRSELRDMMYVPSATYNGVEYSG